MQYRLKATGIFQPCCQLVIVTACRASRASVMNTTCESVFVLLLSLFIALIKALTSALCSWCSKSLLVWLPCVRYRTSVVPDLFINIYLLMCLQRLFIYL